MVSKKKTLRVKSVCDHFPSHWQELAETKNLHSARSYACQLRNGSCPDLDPGVYGFKADIDEGRPVVLMQRIDW